MKIFKHNENKETGKLPLGRKSRKAFAVYVAAVRYAILRRTLNLHIGLS